MRTILQRIASKDTDAIGACLDEYGDLVWRLASRYLDRESGDVEDAVQEVFVEVWLSAGKFDPAKGTEAAYIATIAHRRLTDYQRRLSVRRRVSRPASSFEKALEVDRGAGDRPSAGAGGAKEDRSTVALEAMRALPDEERHTLWLWLYRGLTHREISEATDAPIGTIKSRLRRGILRIGEALGRDATGRGRGAAGAAVGARPANNQRGESMNSEGGQA